MATFTLIDAHVLINGVLLSDHSNSVTVEDSRQVKDATVFGSTSVVNVKGLGEAKITIGMFQDMAAGKTHATLQPLLGSATPVTIEVRATSASRSPTNPAAVMSGLLTTYNFLDGEVGEMSEITAEFINGAQAGITYPTA